VSRGRKRDRDSRANAPARDGGAGGDGPPPAAARPALDAAIAAGLAIATFAIFSRILSNGWVNYDDPVYVTHNPRVIAGLDRDGFRWALTAGEATNWHPLTWVSHMLDMSLFGDDPGAHHRTSVLLHAANAALAFLALRSLSGARWTSAAAAALFAWHPLRVESVAWLSERKDVLSGFFFLAALWAWSGWTGRLGRAGGRPAAFLAASLLLFALGLASKPMIVTFPFVLLLLDAWPLGRLRLPGVARAQEGPASAGPAPPPAALLFEKTPFLLLSLASSVATYLVQREGGAFSIRLDAGERVANALVSVARYLGGFAWPAGLSPIYRHPVHWPPAAVGAAAALVAGLTAGAVLAGRRRPWIPVGWLWFLGMLVPVIGLVQVGLQSMADRYTYLPSLGLGIAILWTLREAAGAGEAARRACVGGIALVLAGCAVRSSQQSAVWRDSETLFEHAVALDDLNYVAHHNLAIALLDAQKPEEAGRHFARLFEAMAPHADRFSPGVRALYEGEANSHYGAILAMQGRLDEARQRFETALRHNPGSVNAHGNLGKVYAMTGRTDEAIEQFRLVLELAPDDARTICNLAEALAVRGDQEEADGWFARGLEVLGPPGCAGRRPDTGPSCG
jgi:tetratricopeptide (TPR) repeat protein